jgi:glycosyltransferase involved in cell wall biosynthesis
LIGKDLSLTQVNDIAEQLALCFNFFILLDSLSSVDESLLTFKWVKSLSVGKLDAFAAKWNFSSSLKDQNFYQKKMACGSADLSGLLWGSVGAIFPKTPDSLSVEERSEFIFSQLKAGCFAPQFCPQVFDAAPIVVLDLFLSQVAKPNDPGLLQLLFGEAGMAEKIFRLAMFNLASGISKRAVARRIAIGIRRSFRGKRPSFLLRKLTPKPLRLFFQTFDRIAEAYGENSQRYLSYLAAAIPLLEKETNLLLGEKLDSEFSKVLKASNDSAGPEAWLGQLDFSADLVKLFDHFQLATPAGNVLPLKKIKKLGLRVSLLLGSVAALGLLTFTATRKVHFSRPKLRELARSLGLTSFEKRLLWITDTFHDHNGVSRFLGSVLRESTARGLPIDFLICSREKDTEPGLQVVKPFAEFRLEKYQDQIIRLPNLGEIDRHFSHGGYEAVISSTEMPMGLVALYLKHAYDVPAYLYMHTDWIDFARKTLKIDESGLKRGERAMGLFYRLFDGVLVLNQEHQSWLQSPRLGLSPEQIIRTAHWADDFFVPGEDEREKLFRVSKTTKVLLFAGRISEEKGVFEIPELYHYLKKHLSVDFKIAFAGTGPALTSLQKDFPEGLYLGWVDPKQLSAYYRSADLLVMPSQFDTFGCVVLEALSCGLPVIAYDRKGPADLVKHAECGYLNQDMAEFAKSCETLLKDEALIKSFKINAVARSKEFTAEKILKQLLEDLG